MTRIPKEAQWRRRQCHKRPVLLLLLFSLLLSLSVAHRVASFLVVSSSSKRKPPLSLFSSCLSSSSLSLSSFGSRNKNAAVGGRTCRFSTSLPQEPQQPSSLPSDKDASSSSSSSSVSSSPWRMSSSSLSSSSSSSVSKDVVIIGGGLAGLSAALHMALSSSSSSSSLLQRRRRITVVDSHNNFSKEPGRVASFAAAGMLAPQSERLPPGPLLDLCLESRAMYADFCQTVQELARHAPNRNEFLWKQNEWQVGYVANGGFLAPAFAGDAVETWSPPSSFASDGSKEEGGGGGMWLEAAQVREMEPLLNRNVVGGWWFPDDARVDARRLTCSLRAAAHAVGVEFCTGVAVTGLDLKDGRCHGVCLADGTRWEPQDVLVANGAWMRQLLPVPMVPHKGQSLALDASGSSSSKVQLNRVLFAQDAYIVPQQEEEGRIIVGATVEPGEWDTHVTPSGLMHCLEKALGLVPALAELPIVETWAGLRPTTPDKAPLLGRTQPWSNVYVAGGYWRNGVLLAPKTGQLVGDLMLGKTLTRSDEALLNALDWNRFTCREKATAMQVAARVAATVHPVHRRSAASSASVGTELGLYSTAAHSAEERARDRRGMMTTTMTTTQGSSAQQQEEEKEEEQEAFERAASLGQRDGAAYDFGNNNNNSAETDKVALPVVVGNDDDDDEEEEEDDDEENALVDSSSLLTHSMSATAAIATATTETPPPPPKDRFQELNHLYQQMMSLSNDNDNDAAGGVEVLGHQDANADADPYADQRDAMRHSRNKNRVLNEVEEAEIGVKREFDSSLRLQDAYQTIASNKAKAKASPPPQEEEEDDDNDLPDPGFRIYHMNDETNQLTLVPPYTTLAEFHDGFGKKSGGDDDDTMDGGSPLEVPQEAQDNDDNDDNDDDDDVLDESLLNGYQDIVEANAATSRQEELQRMKEARIRNRLGMKPIEKVDNDQEEEEEKNGPVISVDHAYFP